jgi:hypothetical protein
VRPISAVEWSTAYKQMQRKLISDHSVFSHFIGPTNFLPTVDFEEFAEYEAGQMNMVDKYVVQAVRELWNN